jgi:hypothetical protein
MAYLTHDQILKVYFNGPPYRMVVYHDPNLWKKITNHKLPTPVKIKFDSNVRNAMPPNIKKGKGIYMFFLEPNHNLPSDVEMKHLLYIGRVQEGKTKFNFYRRFYAYVNDIGNLKAPRNRMRLTNLWPDHTYVYYFDLSHKTDKQIKDIEKNLFNNIIPPLNEELHGASRLTRQFY